jgi:hypothetical protein
MFKLPFISKLIILIFTVFVVSSFPAVNLAKAHEKTEKSAMVIQLLVTGEEGTRFRGECLVTCPEDLEQLVALEGEVPQTHKFYGQEINCSLTQITADGRLEVKVTKADNTSRSRTRGQGSTINIHIR